MSTISSTAGRKIVLLLASCAGGPGSARAVEPAGAVASPAFGVQFLAANGPAPTCLQDERRM
jgi:hypothetical protein